MTQPLLVDAEQVAVAWAKSLELTVGSAVATTVPAAGSWPVVAGGSRAFLQVVATGGGTVRDTPMRSSVISFDSWAVKDGSDRPPLNLASQVLSQVIAACYIGGRQGEYLLVAGRKVEVHSAWPVTEHARRIPDQDTSRAHYSIDIQIMWTAEG